MPNAQQNNLKKEAFLIAKQKQSKQIPSLDTFYMTWCRAPCRTRPTECPHETVTASKAT